MVCIPRTKSRVVDLLNTLDPGDFIRLQLDRREMLILVNNKNLQELLTNLEVKNIPYRVFPEILLLTIPLNKQAAQSEKLKKALDRIVSYRLPVLYLQKSHTRITIIMENGSAPNLQKLTGL